MKLPNWIGKLLEEVAHQAQVDGDPPLTSLCVNHDGAIGEGYARAPKSVTDAPGDDIEMYAANHRLLCYRKSEGHLPTDGGEPALTNAEYERCARKVEQPTPVRPLCAGCFTELPASGRCDYCARSPSDPNDRFQAGCDGVTAPATTTRQVSAPGREAPPEPRTTDGAAPDPRRPPRSGSMSESSSGVTGRASAFSESQISACKLQPISVVQLPDPLQQRSINHTDDATDAPDSTVQAPQP